MKMSEDLQVSEVTKMDEKILPLSEIFTGFRFHVG